MLQLNFWGFERMLELCQDISKFLKFFNTLTKYLKYSFNLDEQFMKYLRIRKGNMFMFEKEVVHEFSNFLKISKIF